MKKIFRYMMLAIIGVLAAACTFDDSELQGQLDDIKDRIAKLQTQIESVNAQFQALNHITSGNVITAVSQNSDGKYVITYLDGNNNEKTVVIATMDQMINVPVLGVELDTRNNLYYWTVTVDGQTTYLMNEGAKVPVSGYTPEISVDAEGYWTVNGQRILDADGRPLEANDGETCVFKSVELNENGDLVITQGNGTIITIPVQQVLNLTLSASINTTVVNVSQPMEIAYEVSGTNAEDVMVAIAETNGLSAVIDREKNVLSVTFPSSFTSGYLIVVANDMGKHTVLRPVFFEKAESDRIEIRTADELVQFAADVNAGTGAEEMKVFLMNDIDMKDVTSWTPIGDVTFTWAANVLEITSGIPFKGTFDGQGYNISNFNLKCENTTANRAWGMFGALAPGAVVKNIVFGETCSLSVSSSDVADFGIVAGLVYDATLQDITNKGDIICDGATGADNLRITAGIAGFAFAKDNGVLIDNIINDGTVTAEAGTNTKNGATAVQVAGIVGFSTNDSNSTKFVTISNCVNNGDITSSTGRASGIVAAANRYTLVTDSVNNGDNFNSHPKSGNARIGNITCVTGAGSQLVNVTNNGDLISSTSAGVGGVVCLVNSADNVFDNCKTYGTVISDKEPGAYCGTFAGNFSKNATFRNCITGGQIGKYNNGEYIMTEVTSDNYWDYIGQHSDSITNLTQETLRFGGEASAIN